MSVQRRGAGAPQDLGILEHFLQNGLSEPRESTSDCFSTEEAEHRASSGLLAGSCRLLGAATPALGHGAAACAGRKMGLFQLWAWQMWLWCLQQPGSLAPLRVHDARCGWKHGCERRGTEQLQGNVPLCSRRLLHLPTPSCWAQFQPRSINIW